MSMGLDGNNQQFAYALELLSSVMDEWYCSLVNVTKAANQFRELGTVQILSTRLSKQYLTCVSGKHFPELCCQTQLFHLYKSIVAVNVCWCSIRQHAQQCNDMNAVYIVSVCIVNFGCGPVCCMMQILWRAEVESLTSTI